MTTFPLVYQTKYCIFPVSPDMLFRRLFIASNPKYLFGNPDWYIKWLGTVDRRLSSLVFRPEEPPHPHFCGKPPPPPHMERDRVWLWWGNNLTVSLVYLAAWAEEGQAIPKIFHVLSCDSTATILRSNPVVGFVWVGLALAFMSKGSQNTRIITIILHLSPQLVTIFEFSPPTRWSAMHNQSCRSVRWSIDPYLPNQI